MSIQAGSASSQRARDPFTADRNDRALGPLLAAVGAIVVLVQWPALHARAICFDDYLYLVENPYVRQPGWHATSRFLTEVLNPSTIGGYYQPLSMISLMLDWAMGGRSDDLTQFHATSLVLHTLNTVLAGLLLHRLFKSAWPAAMVALLFGIHPMTVETIAWIGERKTVLATCFALCGLLCYERYVRGRGWGPYACSILAYALALLAKPTVTPLPLMLLLMDVWPFKRWGRRALVEKFPYLAVGGLSAIVTFISQARTARVLLPGERGGPLGPLMCVCHNIIFYLRKMVWPADLSSHYAIPQPLDLSDGSILAGVIGTPVLIALLLVCWRWSRAPLVCWLIFFVGLLPTTQIVAFSNAIASDKYAYFPAVGLLMLLAAGLAQPLRSGPPSGGRATLRLRATLLVAFLGLAGAEAYASRAYLREWRDTETLFRRMIRLAPDVPSIRGHLAAHLLDSGRFEEALAMQAMTVERWPDSDQAQRIYADCLRRMGRRVEALQHYEHSLRLEPNSPESHTNLAVTLAELGRAAEALPHFEEALRLQPNLATTHYSYATVLYGLGRLGEAIEHFRLSVEYDPYQPDVRNNLAIALATTGRKTEAIEQFRAALSMAPDNKDARFNLAQTLLESGHQPEACVQLRELLKRWPDDAEARTMLSSEQCP